jgi:YggT family protein
MIYSISTIVLQALMTIVGGACLLRCYMQFCNINLGRAAGYQIGGVLLTLSNWLIGPLRKVVPSIGNFDGASLLAAYFIALVKITALWFLSGRRLAIDGILVMSAFEIINLFLSGIIVVVFASVILSWFGASTMAYYFLSSLADPMLRPIRSILPNLGALDLSPLVLLIAVQVVQSLVANFEMMLIPMATYG